MTTTPITDAFGEKLIGLIRTAKEEIPTLGDVSKSDESISGLLVEALVEILAVTQNLEERINSVSESIPDVATQSVTARLRNLSS